jgi:hypothetical protein
MKKRIGIKTTIAPETKPGLEKIARREKLTDHGSLSKGRAIDYLVQKELNNGNVSVDSGTTV